VSTGTQEIDLNLFVNLRPHPKSLSLREMDFEFPLSQGERG